ncbi:hypothetical protein [Curtobacterium sp. MCBD17_019]|uniref:hypothetical protein n=1 Tax=Curtobacterium sp. MCBD17_019 TaxID=2175669 RepID=UPI0015E88940|nr:hypothetical protein [Curtobacterium sp. MCBD17_019]
MTATAQLPVVRDRRVASWCNDGWTVTRRNLLKIRRSPDMLVFAVPSVTKV